MPRRRDLAAYPGRGAHSRPGGGVEPLVLVDPPAAAGRVDRGEVRAGVGRCRAGTVRVDDVVGAGPGVRRPRAVAVLKAAVAGRGYVDVDVVHLDGGAARGGVELDAQGGVTPGGLHAPVHLRPRVVAEGEAAELGAAAVGGGVAQEEQRKAARGTGVRNLGAHPGRSADGLAGRRGQRDVLVDAAGIGRCVGGREGATAVGVLGHDVVGRVRGRRVSSGRGESRRCPQHHPQRHP